MGAGARHLLPRCDLLAHLCGSPLLQVLDVGQEGVVVGQAWICTVTGQSVPQPVAN